MPTSAGRGAFNVFRGPVGGRRGREALGVGSGGAENRHHPRERADSDALGEQVGEVAERERDVVAGGLRGGEPFQQRGAELCGPREFFEAEPDDGVFGEDLEGVQRAGQLLVQRDGGAQVDGADFEGVAERRRDGAQNVRAGAQQVDELGGFCEQRFLVGQRVDRLAQRRRAAFDRTFQRRRGAGKGREEGVELDEQGRLRLGHRRDLFGGFVERRRTADRSRSAARRGCAARARRCPRAGAACGSFRSGRARARRSRRRRCWCSARSRSASSCRRC